MDAGAFDQELKGGSDRFNRGELEQAEAHAGRALQLRPGNPLAQHLMALILLRGGKADQACGLFDALVERNSDVVALRFNAGVAASAAGRWDRAAEHLQRAVELDPTHRRAFAYLALTHACSRQLELARAALLEAELSDLADDLELDRIRAAAEALPPAVVVQPCDGFAEIASVPSAVAEASADEIDASLDQAFEQAFGEEEVVSAGTSAGEGGEEEVVSAGTSAGEGGEEEVVSAGPTEGRPGPTEGSGGLILQPAEGGTGLVASDRCAIEPARALTEFPPLDPPRKRVEISDARLAVALRGEASVFFRLGGLQLATGAARLSPVRRRAKGEWGAPFALAGQPVVEAQGEGAAWLAPPEGERMYLVSLADEALYASEDRIVAFSDGLRWANGWIPGAGQIAAVELAGSGFVAICSRRVPVAVTVKPDRPLTVLASRLIAWSGALVPCAGAGARDELFVECRGDGVVLVGLDGADEAPPGGADPETLAG